MTQEEFENETPVETIKRGIGNFIKSLDGDCSNTTIKLFYNSVKKELDLQMDNYLNEILERNHSPLIGDD